MTDSRDGWLDDLAEASARISQLEAKIENLSFQANSLIERGSSLESENAALREDKARLDWMALLAAYNTEENPTEMWLQFVFGALDGYPMAAPLVAFRAAIDAAREGE